MAGPKWLHGPSGLSGGSEMAPIASPPLLLLPLLLFDPTSAQKITISLPSESLVISRPRQSENIVIAQSYLTKFGHLRAQQTLDAALLNFQAFAGLRQTGDLDKETIETINSPRCGNKDVEDEDEDSPR